MSRINAKLIWLGASPNEEGVFLSREVYQLGLLVLTLNMTFGFILYSLTPTYRDRLYPVWVLIVALGLSLPLFIRKQVRVASLGAAGVLFITQLFAVLQIGSGAYYYSSYIFIILMAGFFVGLRTMVAMTVLTLLSGLTIAYAESGGLWFPPNPNISDPFVIGVIQNFILALNASVAAFVVYYFRRERQRAMAELAERQRTQKNLEVSEARFRAYLEQSFEGVLVVDSSGKIIEWNHALEHICGLTRELALGRPLWEIQSNLMTLENRTPRNLERTKEWIKRVLQNGSGHGLGRSIVNKIMRQDGTVIDIEQHMFLIQNDSAGPRLGCVVRDVTLQRQAEETLRENEERFRTLSDASFEGLIIHDKGVILDANQKFAELFGFDNPSDLIGLNIDNMVTPESSKKMQGSRPLNKETVEITAVRRDGSQFDGEAQWRPIVYRGRPCRVVAMRNITARKQAEVRIMLELNKLAGLRKIDTTITTGQPLQETLQVILDQAISSLNVDVARIHLIDPAHGAMKLGATAGVRCSALKQEFLALDHPLWQAANQKKSIMLDDQSFGALSPEQQECLKQHGMLTYCAVPLLLKDDLKGVVEVFLRQRPPEPLAEWINYLETLAGQAAIAMTNFELLENLRAANRSLVEAYDETIKGWARALEIRDRETHGHSGRVMRLALLLAQEMGMPEEEQPHFRRGVLLHDIGKIGIPDQILLKPGPLNDEEWEVMRQHPALAHRLLKDVPFLAPAAVVPYSHHERWDGSGYPRGLKGEEIPLAARIFAVVDVWDALISDRPYRNAWEPTRVVEYLKSKAGEQFDPRVVEAFLKLPQILGFEEL